MVENCIFKKYLCIVLLIMILYLDKCRSQSKNLYEKPDKNFKKIIDRNPTKILSLQKHILRNNNNKIENVRGFDFDEREMEKLKIWRNGIVPYFIDPVSFDKVLRDRIRLFLGETSGKRTGLEFVELQSPPEDSSVRWVFFINRRGQLDCVDYNTQSFTNTGVQRVVVGYNCIADEMLAATVLALVGVPPQHNAPDRDQHFEIVTDNILPDKTNFFQAVRNDEWLFHDLKYDYHSAGHYHLHTYTKNGSAAIKPKVVTLATSVADIVGLKKGFSNRDIIKMRMMYSYLRQKKPKNKESDCLKIYKAGFSNFSPEKLDEATPRKKPNKYLGVNKPENQVSREHGTQKLSNRSKKPAIDLLDELRDYYTDE